MNVVYVLAHIIKLPQLRAEESLQMITDIAIGTGAMKKEVRRSVLNRLYREVRENRPREKKSKEEQEAILRNMGIRFEHVKN
jgi:hypothetical protein